MPPFEATVKDEVPPFEATVKDEVPPFEATVKDEVPPFQPPQEVEEEAPLPVVPVAPAAEPPPVRATTRPGAETTDPLIRSRRRKRAALLLLPLGILLMLLVTGALAMTVYHLTRGDERGDAPANEGVTGDALSEIVIADGGEVGGESEAESEAETETESEAETETESESEAEAEAETETETTRGGTDELLSVDREDREEDRERGREDEDTEPVRDVGDGMAFAVGEVGGSTRGLPPAGTEAAAELSLSVSGQRRTLRNTTLKTGIDTGTTGCRVQVHWTVEGTGAWSTAALPGDGPAYTWSLPVTAEHRPAILYFVEVSSCGTATHGTAASPERVVVR